MKPILATSRAVARLAGPAAVRATAMQVAGARQPADIDRASLLQATRQP